MQVLGAADLYPDVADDDSEVVVDRLLVMELERGNYLGRRLRNVLVALVAVALSGRVSCPGEGRGNGGATYITDVPVGLLHIGSEV